MGDFAGDDFYAYMRFFLGYYNTSLVGNDTMRRLFATGVLNEVITSFEKRTYKYYLYSDHDDSILILAAVLGVNLIEYPPYSSTFTFELWDTGLRQEVRVRYNDVPVPICGGACHMPAFKQLARSVSYYGDEVGY